MLIEFFSSKNIDQRKIEEIVLLLKKGEVIVVPTDTVYSFACDLNNKKALEKMARLKELKLNKANFSLICHDLSSLSDYTKPLDRSTYKILNKAFPGPYTFILDASNLVPKLFGNKKKEVGIRIPDNDITRTIANTLGNPLAVTSVHDDDEIVDYTTDPQAIEERFEKQVAAVIDAGYGNNVPSTIINCCNGNIEVIREGIGEIFF
ncbi:MAG: L-threonylcarbamoyladenylate synthase [Flavobacteriales bacterium]|jgi:tRNA threonylcarbamoyl adenosine modification protein (Sua5/YciO/YrdC/YwlC family)|nr:L-threonylcarbamoyladenylate synthase [Flavobacteriales bacterium]